MRPPTEVPQTGDRVGASRAVQRLVDGLGERDRIILSARVWSARPQSLRTVAEPFGGVHTVSVSRNQPRAQARFVELLADRAHHEVSKYASALRGRVGPQMPVASPPGVGYLTTESMRSAFAEYAKTHEAASR